MIKKNYTTRDLAIQTYHKVALLWRASLDLLSLLGSYTAGTDWQALLVSLTPYLGL